MSDTGPVSRFALYRGKWQLMQANIAESDQRDNRVLAPFEDASVYVPNAVAAAAPDLLAALLDCGNFADPIASVPDLMEYAASYFDDAETGKAVQYALRVRANEIRAAIAKATGEVPA